MTTPVSGIQPPNASHAARVPGTGGVTRPDVMRVWAYPLSVPGLVPDDHELRRIWVAAIGAGAVEDLLKMIRCAQRRQTVRRPLFLAPLIVAGLAAVNRDVIWVPQMLPPLPPHVERGLSRRLRERYAEWRRRTLGTAAA